MDVVRDVSLRTKLFAGFGVVLLLTVILGIVMNLELGRVNSGGVYLGTNAMPSVQMIGQIRSDFGDYRSAH